jgi:hypothetical protein
MAGPQEQYTDELKSKFGYYATWLPGKPLSLGDIGVFTDNVFTRLRGLEDVGIKDCDTLPDPSAEDLEYNSRGNVSVTTKLSGTISPQGISLANADAGLVVEFGNENSILFKANQTRTPSIKDIIKLGEQVLELYEEGKWNKKWVVVTELVTAESATILISNNKNGRIELKANANIDAISIDIADAKFQFSTIFSKGLETKIMAQSGLTPLFKVMGIKTRIFLPPAFIAKGLSPLDLITPEKAKTEYKDKIYFGYIDSNENE